METNNNAAWIEVIKFASINEWSNITILWAVHWNEKCWPIYEANIWDEWFYLWK